MRLALTLLFTAAAALAAGAAQAADAQLSCRGEALMMPEEASKPLDVTVTVRGGLEAPGAVTYAWALPEASVAMDLKGLSGDTLSFHGIAPATDGEGVFVADAQLNRATLALVLKVRRLGGAGTEDVTFETTCRRG
jgi:hypothetical protein